MGACFHEGVIPTAVNAILRCVVVAGQRLFICGLEVVVKHHQFVFAFHEDCFLFRKVPLPVDDFLPLQKLIKF